MERIFRELGAGIVDLTFTHDLGETTRNMIRLIGEKVLPRVRQLQ